ncbi:MAG: hypothetical protein IT380_17905 [Myxococcales bacterium]|nr:hypothetical protein [Myxococcales bacterium]
MRFLIAGLVLIALGIGLTEYQRRSGAPSDEKKDEPDGTGAKKPSLPPKLARLLELSAPDLAEEPASPDATAKLLASLKTDGPAEGGFSPLLSGAFDARLLCAGFGYAVLALDVGEGTSLLRLEPGKGPHPLALRARRLTALTLDASTLFFAEGGHVFTTSTRGDGPPLPRVTFKNATVTALAASGDDLVAAVVPQDGDGKDGAVVRIDAAGELHVLASDQAGPRAVVTDGKEAFWVADGLWRAALDGSFSSRIAEGADGPLALDGDALVASFGGEVKRLSRAGGKSQTLAEARASALVASSGLIRYATDESPARLFEVTAGAEPTLSTTLGGKVSALALGGTTLFALGQDAAGAVLWAK